MKPVQAITTLHLYPQGSPRRRLFALWYFATLITVWWIAGLAVLGFEQSVAHFVVGAVTSMTLQIVLLWIHSTTHGVQPPFAGGIKNFINVLVPAYIPGIACAMLTYPNERLWPTAFAAAVAICSKAIFRAPLAGGSQHVFNPSNFGVTATLLLFPSVGLAPPYQFTEKITGVWDWVLPGIVLTTGIIIHSVATGRLPLVLAWLGGFVLQGVVRSLFFGAPWLVPMVPMTSAAFILFTLYMIPDPATTPLRPGSQVLFGLAVAALYGVLQVSHVMFGLFISLVVICALRGIWLYLSKTLKTSQPSLQTVSATPAMQTGKG
ncbi:MAG TPA: hypothetical protein VN285_10550 [Candidatus Deferrimicrobium sp.]|nr:hypothetical protein [Candidatus Deferrimicrobium sp.]